MYTYIYIHIHVCIHIHIYIYYIYVCVCAAGTHESPLYTLTHTHWMHHVSVRVSVCHEDYTIHNVETPDQIEAYRMKRRNTKTLGGIRASLDV